MIRITNKRTHTHIYVDILYIYVCEKILVVAEDFSVNVFKMINILDENKP